MVILLACVKKTCSRNVIVARSVAHEGDWLEPPIKKHGLVSSVFA